MTRVNVYLPDDVAQRARAADLNVSAIARAAIEDQLAVQGVSAWLARVASLPVVAVDHADVLEAVNAARDELSGEDDG